MHEIKLRSTPLDGDVQCVLKIYVNMHEPLVAIFCLYRPGKYSRVCDGAVEHVEVWK